MTYEKYEDHLDKISDNKDIVSYDDNCKDNESKLISNRRNCSIIYSFNLKVTHLTKET